MSVDNEHSKILKEFNETKGYPHGKPRLSPTPNKTLKPSDHFETAKPDVYEPSKSTYFIDTTKEHFIRDANDPVDTNAKSYPKTYVDKGGNVVPVFSGSATNVNPFDDEDMKTIIEQGLESSEITKSSTNIPKISPLLPFTRMDPMYARRSNLVSYNRTKLPVSDLEFRKGFRHIFITRPECYIMASSGGKSILSQQAKYDDDFASAYQRMPHICELLSPSYITGSFSADGLAHNWNFLLSNRVDGMSTSPQTSLNYDEAMTKSSEGYTISPGKHMVSRQGSTLTLTFNETRDLEVYTFLQLQMAYIHKRKKGIFAPPYNGYQYKNAFMSVSGTSSKVTGVNNHPYDRALEYGCSIFEVFTNESDTKMLYWCKYYGAYPTEATLNGLSNSKNAPLAASPTVEATFKYHYKLECSNKSLIEFNYNAGLTNHIGKVNTKSAKMALPFLLRDGSTTTPYIGASSMFVGTPYIIMGKSGKDSRKGSDYVYTPYLQFTNITDTKLNLTTNNGITHVENYDGKDNVGVL